MRLAIQDGPITTNGWARFTHSRRVRPDSRSVPTSRRGRLDGGKITPLMERSARTIKDLVESETRDPAIFEPLEPLELPAYPSGSRPDP